MIQTIGLIAAVILPLWNIPLMARIIRRKSSQDISLAWAVGVEACLLLMFPSALVSVDPVYKAFSVVNLALFSVLVGCIIRYHR
ncbi:MAG: hypothetical protein HY737_04950 [Candidatus Omnitrophica bacterium]|nr:hypothetical protein [Candidatus Omnitrophota bacterium]